METKKEEEKNNQEYNYIPRRVVVISIGINEEDVLKFLNTKDTPILFNELFDYTKNNIKSLRYEISLSKCLARLQQKSLVALSNNVYFSITRKGVLLLEVINKED